MGTLKARTNIVIVQSRFRVIYIYKGMYIVCQTNYVGGIMWTKHVHARSQVLGGQNRPVTPVLFISTICWSSFSMDEKEMFETAPGHSQKVEER